jgi:hypothetical protein
MDRYNQSYQRKYLEDRNKGNKENTNPNIKHKFEFCRNPHNEQISIEEYKSLQKKINKLEEEKLNNETNDNNTNLTQKDEYADKHENSSHYSDKNLIKNYSDKNLIDDNLDQIEYEEQNDNQE